MPIPPYAKALVAVNGGANTSGGQTVPSAANVQFSGENTSQWGSQKWELYSFPPGWTAPAGWSTDGAGVIFSTAVLPPAFALPAIASTWGKWMLRLTVNGGLTNGKPDATLVDIGTAVQTLSPKGQHDIAAMEQAQFGGAQKQWMAELQATLRAIESGLAVPMGTGLRKVVGGIENAAASLLVDADVNAAAAIAGTKVSPNFGAQAIVTTGSISIGTPVAASGDLRLKNGFQVRGLSSGAADLSAMESSANDLFLGTDSGFTRQYANVNIYAATGHVALGLGVTTFIDILGNNIEAWQPITGSSLGSSPYSVHGTAISAMTNADYVVPAGEYRYSQIEVPAALTLTAARLFKLPTPATEALSYWIRLRNITTGGFAINATRADGAGVQLAIPNGASRMLRVRPAGIYDETV